VEKVLVVDDSEEIRKQLKWGLGKEFTVLLAGTASEALTLFRKNHPKAVILDLGLPPHEDGTEEGFRCLRELLKGNLLTKVIVATGNEDRENALRAIHIGAYDFYQKPVDLRELKVVIQRALHLFDIEEENARLQQALESRTEEFGGMLGQCPEIMKVFSTIRKIATADIPVLVVGESGTGKELVARAIHTMSLRSMGPFVPINCGAIPENLLESELFGFEKGAFTGAHAQVQGKVEYAHEGTLYLDEVVELPPNLQVKLLRFLQEKIIQRVGGRENIPINARIIAATNMEIESAIQAGRFREDLYYRIGVVMITLPPLRERGDDVNLLANFFLRRFSQEFAKKIKGFSPGSVEFLQSYQWPGNVRELENKLQRAVIMCEGSMIEPHDLGFAQKPEKQKATTLEVMTIREARERAEKEVIFAAVARHGGNTTRAAEELGISRPTLYDLMKKYGLHDGLH
jgi:two-component system NtrC family response regulator